MQIKPHQIPQFARQRERLAEIRKSWNYDPKEEGSYFSKIWEKTLFVDFNFSYGTIDSHGDVHLKGCFGKSILNKSNTSKVNLLDRR